MKIHLRTLPGNSTGYYLALAGLLLLVALGAYAAWTMEHLGHVASGMNNQIVWGLPHIFAVFLIVAATGALNVASMASVFGKTAFKPLAPLSALLAITLLCGGLAVLVLDLGRPERLLVALTHSNFKSIFALNVILYSGFLALVSAYLWTMLEWRAKAWSAGVGVAALIWRITLTTGTGSIFGFLIGRQALGSALLGPMFVVYSLSYGMAVFVLALLAISYWTDKPLDTAMLARLLRLQAIFIALVLFVVLVYHLTHLYFAKQHGVERFLLLEGGIYTTLFWLVQVLLGNVLPLVLLLRGRPGFSRAAVAALLVCLGGLAQMYVTIVGSQAYSLVIFPGYAVSSSFGDGAVASYTPAALEWLLGLGGMALAALITLLALKWLALLPQRLDRLPPDEVFVPATGAQA